MFDMTKIELLRHAIRDQHGLDSRHVESVTLREMDEGETVRVGTVHVFRVVGHPQAELAYAWSCQADDGEVRHIAVLGVPPIDSAERAYQAAVLAELRGDRLETKTDPDLLAVFRREHAAWEAKSYDDLRAALAVENAEVCYRRGPDDRYKVEAQILARGEDYLQVWVSVGSAPHDKVFGGFIRHADGRLETCPDLADVFDAEWAEWTAKSYAELREALADVIAGTTCCINYTRGPDDLYQVEVQPLESRPDYFHVLVSICAPYDAVNRSFIRHAEGRLDA